MWLAPIAIAIAILASSDAQAAEPLAPILEGPIAAAMGTGDLATGAPQRGEFDVSSPFDPRLFVATYRVVCKEIVVPRPSRKSDVIDVELFFDGEGHLVAAFAPPRLIGEEINDSTFTGLCGITAVSPEVAAPQLSVRDVLQKLPAAKGLAVWPRRAATAWGRPSDHVTPPSSSQTLWIALLVDDGRTRCGAVRDASGEVMVAENVWGEAGGLWPRTSAN